MTTFIFTALSYLLLYKYIALFLVAYTAALLIPLPSNTSLVAVAAFASQGYLNMYTVVIVAVCANVFDDWSGFLLSRFYGKSFLIRIGLQKVITSKEYLQAEGFIQRNPKSSIFITRFFGGIGPLVNILAGLSGKISFKQFFVIGVAGELVYVIALTAVGYFLGDYLQDIVASVESISTGVFILVCCIAVYILILRKNKKPL